MFWLTFVFCLQHIRVQRRVCSTSGHPQPCGVPRKFTDSGILRLTCGTLWLVQEFILFFKTMEEIFFKVKRYMNSFQKLDSHQRNISTVANMWKGFFFRSRKHAKRIFFFQKSVTSKWVLFFVLWWRSGFDLSFVIRDPEIESCCSNTLQGRRRDLSSQEASLIWHNTIVLFFKSWRQTNKIFFFLSWNR